MNFNPLITVKDLSVSYERKRVLSNIFLTIDKSGLYGIVGPNGAGKSTFLKALLGLTELQSGEIKIYGQPLEAERRRRIAYVPQKNEVDWQFPANVFDVALMGRYAHKKLWQRIDETDRLLTQQALRDVGMETLQDRQIGELSGGQQQRVFLARALAQQPDILLLDEPFAGVDVTTEERIIFILKKLAAQGKTILVVHHDLSSVKSYFDSVIMINQRLVAFGDTATTFIDENIARTYGGQLNVLHKIGMVG